MTERTIRVAIVYHSRSGHTAAIAEHVRRGTAVVAGIEPLLFDVTDGFAAWDILHDSRAIIFGCPTHFGGVSAEMKRFLDETDAFWREMKWRDKLAAGFTCAGEPSGDKLTVLQQLVIFAGQHGMVWVGIDPMKDPASAAHRPPHYNRQGGYIGAMADADGGEVSPTSPPLSDRITAECLGRRVAGLAAAWPVPLSR
jgi:NAD(P)H dehydrogenase (quinone)